MRNDVLGQVVLKDIHCPNSECPSFVTLEPIRCNEPELELLREEAELGKEEKRTVSTEDWVLDLPDPILWRD